MKITMINERYLIFSLVLSWIFHILYMSMYISNIIRKIIYKIGIKNEHWQSCEYEIQESIYSNRVLAYSLWSNLGFHSFNKFFSARTVYSLWGGSSDRLFLLDSSFINECYTSVFCVFCKMKYVSQRIKRCMLKHITILQKRELVETGVS